jgi:hypothetical protein
MSLARLTSVPVALAAFACGGSEPSTQPIDPCAGRSLSVSLALADVRADAAPGTATATIAGDFPRTITGRASGFSRTVFPSLLVVDAFTVDGVGRPTGELFIFRPGTPAIGAHALVPVTLQQVRDPNFVPQGPFAIWAEAFDAGVGDYTRWLAGDAGTLGITAFRDGEVGRVGITLSAAGSWRDQAGAHLGCGRITTATIDAPVVRGASPTARLVDTLEASVTRAQTEMVGTQTIDAFQSLRPNDTRLLLVATIPGDATRELWLSLSGVQLSADSIPLGELSLAGARAGRDAGSFAMLRVVTLSGTTPVVTQIWRSTAGWVKLTNVVPGAPLILCGWATARFAFTAVGHTNATGESLGTLEARGVFEARYTVLSPTDSLVNLSASQVARIGLAAPGSARDRRCFL